MFSPVGDASGISPAPYQVVKLAQVPTSLRSTFSPVILHDLVTVTVSQAFLVFDDMDSFEKDWPGVL